MASSLLAQMGRQAPTAKEQVATLKKQLSLTAEQEKKILPILEKSEARIAKRSASIQQMFQSGNLDREKLGAHRKQMREEMDEVHAKIESNLTKKQVKLYREILKKRIEEAQKRREQRRGMRSRN